MSPLKRTVVALCVASLLWPRAADALSLCTVLCSCTVGGPISITFTSGYNPINNTETDAVANIPINCSLLTGIVSFLVSYVVGVDKGTANSYSRKMSGPTTAGMQYNIYSDIGMQSILEDVGTLLTIPSQLTVTTAGVNVQQLIPVYIKIPAGQNLLKPGSYTDTLHATVQF